MVSRLTIHQPVPQTQDLASAEKQRIFDLLSVQRSIQSIIEEIASKPHLDSFLLEDLVLTTGAANFVKHKLNRKVRGWFICKQNANAVIWEDETEDADEYTEIALKCSANITITLVVY